MTAASTARLVSFWAWRTRPSAAARRRPSACPWLRPCAPAPRAPPQSPRQPAPAAARRCASGTGCPDITAGQIRSKCTMFCSRPVGPAQQLLDGARQALDTLHREHEGDRQFECCMHAPPQSSRRRGPAAAQWCASGTGCPEDTTRECMMVHHSRLVSPAQQLLDNAHQALGALHIRRGAQKISKCCILCNPSSIKVFLQQLHASHEASNPHDDKAGRSVPHGRPQHDGRPQQPHACALHHRLDPTTGR